jgi:RNA recognition motif-containing protein
LVSRIPTSKLKVEFYGPDLTKEQLFREFRTYGRIKDIRSQPASSKDTPRFATIEFQHKRASTSAKNCVHGEKFDDTSLEISYVRNERHIRFLEWVQANSRISILILLGIIGIITYTVFDPWREFSVTNKLTGRYDLQSWVMTHVFSVFDFVPWLTRRRIGGRDDTKRSKDIGFNVLETQEKKLSSVLMQMPDNLILVVKLSAKLLDWSKRQW